MRAIHPENDAEKTCSNCEAYELYDGYGFCHPYKNRVLKLKCKCACDGWEPRTEISKLKDFIDAVLKEANSIEMPNEISQRILRSAIKCGIVIN